MGATVLCAGALTSVSAASVPPASSPTHSPTHSTARAIPASAARTTAPVTVYWRGNGHGHGLSQYGAHGAAMQGLSTSQILAFYYPGTKLVTAAPSTIRVAISEAASNTTVVAGTKGLTLSGYGTLPATGYTRFRLVPSGAGLRLDGLKSCKWTGIKNGLPVRADFSSGLGWVQALWSDGSSTRYRGSVGAVRSGSSEITVNRVALDLYVQGSVPREMPISWEPAAYHAQAIAARSYAEAVRAYSSGGLYDICDTPSCQVYGGMAHYDASGNLLWNDAPQAVAGNQNQVLRYAGQPVFAQYSASNGGATVDGGRPYLIGRTDPYDTAASGDPYLDESGTTSVSSVAQNLGLSSLSTVTSVVRDGHGPWGGRVVSAKVVGTDYSGTTRTVTVDGFDLGDAMGAGTDYLRFDLPAATPRYAPRSVTAASGDGGARISWAAPQSGSTVTGYRVTFGSHTQVVAASTRSLWVGPLNNSKTTSVSVRAVNSAGYGPAGTVAAKGVATARRLVALTPKRLFDTRPKKVRVDPAHPYTVNVAGLAGLPRTGATSVQISLSLVGATASGVLRVSPAGVYDQPVAAVAYRAGHTTTATISVPLAPGPSIRFTPSAGSLQVVGDVLSYAPATGGAKITPVAPATVANLPTVPMTGGALIDVSKAPGVTSSTTGVVLAVDAHGPTQGGLSLWPDGTARPNVRHVTMSPYASGTTVLVVPLGASHRLRMIATASRISANVRVVGVLRPSGGGLVSYPSSMVADGAHAVTVGTTAVTVPVAGVNQVPSRGAAAVLLQVTVTGAGAGQLVAYPAGAGASAVSVVRFGAHVTTTGTALVRLGSGGAVSLRSSVPGVRVAVDSIGYVTGG